MLVGRGYECVAFVFIFLQHIHSYKKLPNVCVCCLKNNRIGFVRIQLYPLDYCGWLLVATAQAEFAVRKDADENNSNKKSAATKSSETYTKKNSHTHNPKSDEIPMNMSRTAG